MVFLSNYGAPPCTRRSTGESQVSPLPGRSVATGLATQFRGAGLAGAEIIQGWVVLVTLW